MKKKTKKKSDHIYADWVIAEERGKELKSCHTCGESFIGRPSFCPACYQTELKLKRKLLGKRI